MTPSILIVVPTYGHFEYAARAVTTALANTRTLKPHVLVVDDASPDFKGSHFDAPDRRLDPDGRISVIRFPQNGGLTRSWNQGLVTADFVGHDFCCVTNSDVEFPIDWDREIFNALTFQGYHLVGPVTNAPGSNPDQYVGRYSMLYDKAKAQDEYNQVQGELLVAQRGRYKDTTLNGFCMVAMTKTWWENAYDKEHVFRPRNEFNSKGERNPTPLMTLNEYELQRRWHDKGLKTGACLGSYVFHYRAVSRGDKHKRGDWARINEGTS